MDKRGSTDDFDAFVKGQQLGDEGVPPIDWDEEREEWLDRLDELYKKIEVFLKKYIVSGTIKCDYRNITLNEENIGSYTARQMILKIGRQEIVLTPAGTLLIGAKGRVDVNGPAGRARFVLVDSEDSRPKTKVTVRRIGTPRKEIKWAWKIATNVPRIHYMELTKDSFSQVLMEVANG